MKRVQINGAEIPHAPDTSTSLAAASAGGSAQDDDEARATLGEHAHGRFGRLPGERIAAHILAGTPERDWTVRGAALDALARRWGFAERDGLRIDARPKGALGMYRVGRAGKRRARGADGWRSGQTAD
mgnify:CR=1 FL=1